MRCSSKDVSLTAGTVFVGMFVVELCVRLTWKDSVSSVGLVFSAPL